LQAWKPLVALYPNTYPCKNPEITAFFWVFKKRIQGERLRG